ncbi:MULTISPECIES: sugar ABC transporter ATP-binding protein [unclassified Neisseria]|uniref:sugar ABC transporter ATP-binding protein n=1 Tax=unclassified Neisseria TaxID=2623750 RepID=UPI0026664FDD|nr:MULTISPECIES: sugar ABC transporter ATP-binding protein [unclassified Neisseria]MDO1509184.1 sugar ABC transporter ATP-binding protein [Neisseria sp. MVDL19-042950]MDO1515537.1 sugar ABC transporter ATP-binding protein [Neisseria sp. MVDL18-041461]MDO1562896.1 sugar ABC transporter ATP-binding protein [Neisseria sp. MVDL20-010259]
MTTQPRLLVEMRQINKSFGPVQVLRGIDFDLHAGEVHALMGENGAGKSTLMKILTGIYQAEQGQVLIDGQPQAIKTPVDAQKLGIAIIHQELNLLPEMTVAENFFLGREIVKHGILQKQQMNQIVATHLSALQANFSPDTLIKNLSVGQQQLVEIARALSADAKVIIMDEPTAALTEPEIQRLFALVNQLAEKGVGLVYVSHRLEEIFQICHRITVLRDGISAGTKAVADTNFNEIVSMMVGRELNERFPERDSNIGEVKLQVSNLSDGLKVHDVSFDVRAGEVLALAGLIGSGRTEIANLLFGLSHCTQGEIRINGEKVNIKTPRHAIHHKIAYVTEDRKAKGLILDMSVLENSTLAHLPVRRGLIDRKQEENYIKQAIEKLKIKVANPEEAVRRLSGGNQQKVVLAKWLMEMPEILILDEPTRGVDVGGKAEIYRVINELSKKGVAIIMISSELPEVLGVSDRVAVMCEGHLTGILNTKQADQEKIMALAAGGNAA